MEYSATFLFVFLAVLTESAERVLAAMSGGEVRGHLQTRMAQLLCESVSLVEVQQRQIDTFKRAADWARRTPQSFADQWDIALLQARVLVAPSDFPLFPNKEKGIAGFGLSRTNSKPPVLSISPEEALNLLFRCAYLRHVRNTVETGEMVHFAAPEPSSCRSGN